jgi:CheY-like chemotaxis protein
LARKILLADDSVTAQNMGRRILTDAGYEVITVNNGSAALKKIPEENPDLLILDVYMPGYGGLEVCQRIKDSPETAHIPVLLTVGKLEPFKTDEARRVRGDAHLVKPFEASELLTALTKLEDKIVPRAVPRPASSATSATATKTSERSGTKSSASSAAAKNKKASGAEFDDTSGGWKDRLKISSPMRQEEPVAAPEPAPAARTAFRDFVHVAENVQPAASVSAPPGAVVGDITAEEIAAIAAAAAACSARTDVAEAEPWVEPVAAEESVFAPAVPQQDLPEVVPEAHFEEPVAFGEAEAAAIDAMLSTGHEIGSHDTHAQGNSISGCEVPTGVTAKEISDAEVVAALESLIPVHGNGGGLDYIAIAKRFDAAMEEHEQAPEREFVSAHPVAARSHWTAQEVELSQEEAACILEQEMDKAYAALTQSGLAGVNSQPVPPEAASWSSPEAGVSASYADYGSPAIESSPHFDSASQASTEDVQEVPVAAAFTVESENLPGPEVYEVAEAAAADVAASDDAPVSQPQTWADMAWSDSPGQSLEVSAEIEAQQELAAPVDDEPILAEARPSIADFAQEPASTETPFASAEAVTDWASDTTQPQAEAVWATESQSTSIDAQLAEAHSAADDSLETAEWAAPEREAEPVEAVASHQATSSGESPAIESPAADSPPMIESMMAAVDETIADNKPEAALAASASGGFGFRSITHDEPAVETPPPSAPAASAPAADSETTPEREAELAAAWAHWKQIRESISSPQFASQIADVAAAEVREAREEAPVPAEPEAASALPEADASSIASIVDSVLADLRPKLVAEIAKKLSKK